MGRPQIKIDPAIVKALAQHYCTLEEIGAVVGCSEDTLERRFADVIAKGRAERRAKLRQLQLKAADAGNITMMIWLGKQMLGQTDKLETDNTNRDIHVTFDDLPKPKGEKK